MKYKIIIGFLLICTVFMSFSGVLANEASTGGASGFDLNKVMGDASSFFGDVMKSGQAGTEGSIKLNALFGTDTSSGLIGMVFTIGNLIVLASIVFVGIRYIWSGVEGKSQIKESLINMSVGVVFFYLAQGIYNIFSLFLVNNLTESTFDNFANNTWAAVAVIAQYASLAGLVAVGIKYMLTNADSKADIKRQLLPVIIGLVLVFCVTNVANFIVSAAGSALNVSDTSDVQGYSGGSADTVENAAKTLYGSFATIAQILSVGAMVFTGIRFMFASADKRADIKGQTIILLLGAVIVFGAVEVAKTIKTTGEQLLKSSSIESDIVIARSIDE